MMMTAHGACCVVRQGDVRLWLCLLWLCAGAARRSPPSAGVTGVMCFGLERAPPGALVWLPLVGQ